MTSVNESISNKFQCQSNLYQTDLASLSKHSIDKAQAILFIPLKIVLVLNIHQDTIWRTNNLDCLLLQKKQMVQCNFSQLLVFCRRRRQG